MWLDRLLNSPARSAIELAARYAERRHQVLVENVANIDTPDYQEKRLDPQRFQAALRDALAAQRGPAAGDLVLNDRQVRTDAGGRMEVTPDVEPAENVLFHDGTNARFESLMTEVQENAMNYDLVTSMLKSRFDSLLTAIRGRST